MDPALAAVLAALVAGLGSFLVAVRRFSGKIESSEAHDLWAESRAIRDWSQAQILTLNSTIGRLEERIAELEKVKSDLLRENLVLLNQLAKRGISGG